MTHPSPGPPADQLAALGQLQQTVARLLEPVRHPRICATLALCEETGEITRHVMAAETYGQPIDQAALAAELADTLIALMELATVYNIDLGSAIADKLENIRLRVPKWSAQFGPSLALRRDCFDQLNNPPPAG